MMNKDFRSSAAPTSLFKNLRSSFSIGIVATLAFNQLCAWCALENVKIEEMCSGAWVDQYDSCEHAARKNRIDGNSHMLLACGFFLLLTSGTRLRVPDVSNKYSRQQA